MEEIKICTYCGCVIEEYEQEVNGELYCDDCFNELFTVCDECGEIVNRDNTSWFEGEQLVICDDCAREYFVTCSECDELVRESESYTTAHDDYICCDCYDRYYYRCNDCGDIYHQDEMVYNESDDEYYCERCYEENCGVIHDYYYKPEPIFHGESERYLGVELEIDGAGEDNDNAQKILDLEENIYCKHDGSLNEGFEIVSHPCDLEYHMRFMNWKDIMREAVRMGYTSHDAGTCGLHIHISRDGLGQDIFERERTVGKILYFIELEWEKMLVFSRRTQDQLDRWARRYGISENDTPNEMLNKAKKDYGRYRAINLQPYKTIEFRLFRGTLKYNTFIATLQLVDALCEYCIVTDDEKKLNWSDFVATIKYPELLNYLEERGI